ncbi:MAG: beta-ketoacyl-[acyl-carrier-protein] synthase family protein, partial [Oligoflexia bacterium]|nr:beta-ketoacyl-[acyl-carrier-protein] synthase family protein [Oligoflexia bacterium]
GDIIECEAVSSLLGQGGEGGAGRRPAINGMKDLIGHTMGASGALELAGNIPSFVDGVVHPFTNVEELDPRCNLPGLVLRRPEETREINYILNNSFGMLGINSSLLVKRFSNR